MGGSVVEVAMAAPPRLRWEDLPEPVRAAAEVALGAGVVSDVTQTGGFSPGLASRLILDDGRRVFAKAISAARDPRSPGLYRRKIEVMTTLPAEAPAPGLRWSFDDGDWVMLVLDDVNGTMPAQPWRQEEFARVLTALEHLADTLTPAPLAAMSIVDDLAENFRSWHTIAADPPLAGCVDSWAQANLERLVELESGWADAAWVDMLLFLPSVTAANGINPGQVWSTFLPAREADPNAVNAVLAAVAGDFLYQSMLPAPANLPTLRAHQREKGMAALSWLRSRIS
jgi:hypothetical protein